MPSFANGVDSFAGVVQEQVLASDLEHLSTGVETGSPSRFANLLTGDERKEEISNPLQMVELIQTAQRLHEMGSQALRHMSGITVWNSMPSAAESGHDFSLLFENKSQDSNQRFPIKEEDRTQLGAFLHRLTSSSCQQSGQGKMVRKRSHSSMQESEELDQSGRLRSYTSSESDVGAGEEAHFSLAHSHFKLRAPKTEIGPSENDKELLSLSLPVSSINSESSSSSRELDLQLHSKSDACVPVRSCKIYVTTENDGAESEILNATTISSTPGEYRSKLEDHVMQQRVSSADDAGGDTSTHSSTEPTSPMTHGEDQPGVQLSLKMDSLKASQKPSKIAKFLPLLGQDAGAMNQRNLLRMRVLDTGLETHGLQLVQLLLKCANAIDQGNAQVADTILRELYQGASVFGDAMQRIAAYFADGLALRLMSKDCAMYSTLMIQPTNEEYLSAFTSLYKVAPYYQFAHFTANQAMLEALEGHNSLHVIDLDIVQGLQWPAFLQALGSRPGGPPHLRLTGVGRNASVLRETGRRLTSFAEEYNVQFEYQAVVEEKLENLTPEMFALKSGEAVAVNSVMQLHRLLNPSSGENLHNFLHSLCRSLNPRVVTMVEQEANHNTSSFLGRFMEALNYYAAIFDSLDASLPQQSEERVKVEQVFFSQQIKNIVVCDGDDRVERQETFDRWGQRMQMAGFVQVPLSAYALSQAKLLIQLRQCAGYELQEKAGSISLAWQQHQLVTASAWSCS